MPHRKIRLDGGLRKTIPRAHQLAVVAAVDAIAYQRAQLDRDAAFELDSEIGNAAARIQPVWRDDCPGRAYFDATRTGSAMIFLWHIHRQRQVHVYLAEKEPRAVFAGKQQGVLAAPTQAGFARQLHLHHRRTVSKDPPAEFSSFSANLVRQFCQPIAHHLVIIAPQGIARNERALALCQNLPAVARLVRQIVHAQ